MRRALADRRALWVVGIFACTCAAYLPVFRAGFIWDDDGHVTRPDLRTLAGLGRIWFRIGATQQYYPVLHSAFWLEHRLWGDSPLGYHLINLAWHAGAACLLIAVLRRLRVPGAAWAGLLFALHPVAVESVAWISEQKNTLSAVFYFGAALAYLGFDEERRASRYALATLLFLLALLSKTVTATLPAALLVAVWWRRGRLAWRDVLPLAPWFAAAGAAGWGTAWLERHYIGAQGVAFDLGFGARLILAGKAIWFYLGKLVWPHHLVFIYPRWVPDVRMAGQYAYPAAALGALAALVALRKRTRGPLAAALWFGGTLFPALGFVNVYPFVFSFVADHFQYLASAAVFALAAGGLGHWVQGRPGARPRAFAGAAGLALLLGVLTWRQARIYRDEEGLYRETLARNPAAWLAHDNLGILLARSGRIQEAMTHYQAALRLDPEYPETYNNIANVLARLGRWEEAAPFYRRALALRPKFAPAAENWAQAEYEEATALGNAGRIADAIAHYRQALRLRPDYEEAHANLGLALAYSGDLAAAAAEYREALRLNPADSAAQEQFQAVQRELQLRPAPGRVGTE